MTQLLRKISSAMLPRKVLELMQALERKIYGVEIQFKDLSNQEIFTKIYDENWWGGGEAGEDRFCSGSGSHDPVVVKAYVDAIIEWLDSFSGKKILVDLGCGDFNVGSKIAPMASSYIACDIVKKMIAHNRTKYKDNNIDFRVLDLTKDVLPQGDIVFVRQVLQHLSNEDIDKFSKKVKGIYSYLVLSEHLPQSKYFVPNLDKPSGSRTRLFLNSGVVITEPPFSFDVVDEKIICEIGDQTGIIRTTVYKL